MTSIDSSYGLYRETTGSRELSDITFGYVSVKDKHVRKAEPAVVLTREGQIDLARSCYVNNPPPSDNPLQSEVIRFSEEEVKGYIQNKYPGYEIIHEPEK